MRVEGHITLREDRVSELVSAMRGEEAERLLRVERERMRWRNMAEQSGTLLSGPDAQGFGRWNKS